MRKKLILILFLCLPEMLYADTRDLTSCRVIKDSLNRVACYDAYVDSRIRKASGEDMPSSMDSVRSDETQQDIVEVENLFGKSSVESKQFLEEKFSIKKIDQIVSKVDKVRRLAHKKVQVYLENGQVWRQLDNEPIRIRKGDEVVVRTAALGSFLLGKKSGGSKIRVKRTN